MIGYATKPEFIRKVSAVLQLVGEHLPHLVPSKIEARIVPATFFRFGYIEGHPISKSVMVAHDSIAKIQKLKKAGLSIDFSKILDTALREPLSIIYHRKRYFLGPIP